MRIAEGHHQWLAARRRLLDQEKALTRMKDALAAQRRALPRIEVTADYRFTGAAGEMGLADLFGAHPQLALYHFMLADGDAAGCKSCSFWIDNLDGVAPHLAARGVRLMLVSSAPWDQIAAYRDRMGWSVDWVSCDGSGFNRDMGVSFAGDEAEPLYNFTPRPGIKGEMPGFSAWEREGDRILLSYAAFGRGLDHINGAYQLLDLMPRGRDEDGLGYSMEWLRRHDEY